MATENIQATAVVDARGLLCPMPVVNTAKAMRQLEVGQVLRLISTDRGSVADIPAWAESTGNLLVDSHEEAGEFVFTLKKGG